VLVGERNLAGGTERDICCDISPPNASHRTLVHDLATCRRGAPKGHLFSNSLETRLKTLHFLVTKLNQAPWVTCCRCRMMRQQDRVIAESGQLVEADYCIVTIPIACLKDCCVVTSPELVISSRLSPKKDEAIDTLHRWVGI
jgi:hypothetical protein